MYEISVACRVLVFHQVYISDTEIDWETYMYHIKIHLDGERDYSAIDGPTGPLV
jgi:ALG3 protein